MVSTLSCSSALSSQLSDSTLCLLTTAHFLAEKGRGLIYGPDGGFSDTASSVSGGGGRDNDERVSNTQRIAEQLARPALPNCTRKFIDSAVVPILLMLIYCLVFAEFGRTLWYM